MAAASATGEKLPVLVIWKSKNPHCFNNVKHLPCKYKSQKNALPRKGCAFVMQSLGEKRDLSKDFNFAISEDTG